MYGLKGWDDAVPPELYDHALETGMFEYDNGNMKMYHDIDMDYHRIKNLPQPTNPNDILMVQSIRNNPIYLYGAILENRHFAFINDIWLHNLKNIRIRSIEIHGGNKYRNTQDSFHISYANNNIDRNMFMRINFPPTGTLILALDISFDTIYTLSTEKAKNIPFIIVYSPTSIQ